MKYISLFSGAMGLDLGLERAGFEPAVCNEIDAEAVETIRANRPNLPVISESIANITGKDLMAAAGLKKVRLIVGGPPCQAFSVAGARKSLDDDRGQLTLEYVRLANAIDEKREEPCITVWENVPGVLNTKDNAFGCFLGALAGESGELKPSGGRWSNAGCVFGPQRAIAWRILDAQYFGVAQRRRRVFVV